MWHGITQVLIYGQMLWDVHEKPALFEQCLWPHACSNLVNTILQNNNLCPAAFTHDNLDGGEWYVPGTVLGGAVPTDPFWKQVKAQNQNVSLGD